MQRQIITMKAFIINEEKNTIFLMRKKSIGDYCSKWEIPSGSMELGETTTETFKKEVKKECGLNIEVGKHMTRPWQWMIGTSDGNFVHMIAVGKVCRILEKKELCPRRKYLETKWVPIEEVLEYDLETNLIPNMKLFIAYYRDRKQHELPVFVKDDGDLQSIFEYRPPKSKQIKRVV